MEYTNRSKGYNYETSIQRKWLGTYNGVAKNPDNLMAMMMSCVFTKEHTFFQSLGFMKRFENGMNLIWPHVMKYNFIEQAADIKVPVFIIGGKYDKDTPNELVKEFFGRLNAPRKEFYIFENSAHLAPFKEPERFYRIMQDTVLTEIEG